MNYSHSDSIINIDCHNNVEPFFDSTSLYLLLSFKYFLFYPIFFLFEVETLPAKMSRF